MNKPNTRHDFSAISDELVNTIVEECKQQNFKEPDDLVKEFLMPMLADVASKSLGKLLGNKKTEQIKVEFSTDPLANPEELSLDKLLKLTSIDLSFEIGQLIHKKMASYPESARQLLVVITALSYVLHDMLAKDSIKQPIKLNALSLFNDVFVKMNMKDVVHPENSKMVH